MPKKPKKVSKPKKKGKSDEKEPAPVQEETTTSPVANTSRAPKSLNRIDTSLNTSMYVANLPFKVRDADLFAIFKDYDVKNAYVVKRQGRSKGFGFVEFSSTAERDRVLNEVTDAIVNERVIIMKPAVAKTEGQENDAENA